MITSICYYIVCEGFGKFVGDFMGMGFFEYNIFNGDVGPDEVPIPFATKSVAEQYLDSWDGGREGMSIVEGILGEGITYTRKEFLETKQLENSRKMEE